MGIFASSLTTVLRKGRQGNHTSYMRSGAPDLDEAALALAQATGYFKGYIDTRALHSSLQASHNIKHKDSAPRLEHLFYCARAHAGESMHTEQFLPVVPSAKREHLVCHENRRMKQTKRCKQERERMGCALTPTKSLKNSRGRQSRTELSHPKRAMASQARSTAHDSMWHKLQSSTVNVQRDKHWPGFQSQLPFLAWFTSKNGR
eukprot:1139767-Pelagomonas_calceolata.AAC.3